MIRNTDVQKKHSGERIRNSVCTVLVCAALFLAQSCTNVIHELIPPSDSGIHSFSVENTDRTRWRAAETDSTDITITVPAGTDVTALLPIIESGDKSTVLPVTLPYIHRAFPSADLMSLAVQMNASQKAGDLGNWMLNFIRENKDFSVPPLDEPVDFTQPVMFCIIAGRGNYKLYTVTVVPEKTENPAEPDTPSPSEPDNPDEPGTPDEPSVPPQAECEKKILSFVVNEPKQTKPSVITEDTVTFYLNAGADSSALYPVITVSEGAGILPLTQEYLLRLFSYTEMISLYSGYSTATDANAFISAAVKKLDADKIAKIMEADLSLPIDFSGLNSLFGVPFAVVGADKTVHIYSISGVTAEDTAALTAFAVTKIRNPGLMGDADVSFSGDAVTITATYPVEYQNFKLIPDIVIDGDTWEITGGTLRAEDVGASGEETECTAGLKKAVYLVPGDAYPVGNEYTATLTVRRGEAAATYTLRLIYKENEDTIRSITDFRFLRLRNPGIKTTSMASISKSEDTGFISAAVMYEGDEPPYDLVADFYSPGTCTVEHAVQVSGKSRNNFRYDVQILCTSKNKLFCRLYTVHVTFIKVKTAEAVLNYFAFPKHLNPDLSQSATGLIDESSGTVYVNAKYHTPEKPAHLVPEFAATGTVSVNSILQSSGYSAQDFSRSIYYSVRDQNDWSSDSRTYRISVNWEQDEQSACAITGFGFSTADNPSLEKDVSARINERAGTIYALLPKDAGKSDLAPYFSAKGTVTVNGGEQTSGSSRQDFSDEVVYTVTSANGLYTKQYSVSVQEAGPVIYVNAAAIGRNNGTCWQDAYITLDAAFEQAQAYGDAHKEIWIAYNGGEAYAPLSDAYRTNGLPLTANTTVRGGFVGTETDADERRKNQREKIEFDVTAVETAYDDKGEIIYNTKITHNSIGDDVYTQTKLLQPNGSPDSHLFCGGTLSGNIEFDGIDMEATFEEGSKNFLLDVNDMKTATFSLIDCTVRCLAFSQQNSEHSMKAQNIFLQNSDLYIDYLAADTIEANNSCFYAQNTDHDSIIYGTAEYTNCYFNEKSKKYSSYDLTLGHREQTVSVKKCFFEYGSYSSDAFFRAEECHLKLDESPRFSFIKDCYIYCYTVDCHSNIDIEGSYITPWQEAFSYAYSHWFEFEKFSLKNSIVDKKNNYRPHIFSFEYSSPPKEESVIELENSKIIGFDGVNSRTTVGTITMINCSFDFDSKYEVDNSSFISSAVKTINIENCNFDLQNKNFIDIRKAASSLKIKHNTFKLPKGNFSANLTGEIEFTDNVIESELSSIIHLISSDSLTFTGNEFHGRWTDIKATNIKEFAENTYDSFVIYDISVGDNKKQPDFSTEKIIIKNPLYTANGKEYEEKAYLTLTNGEITNVSSADFFCGYNLLNSNAILSNLNLSEEDFPLYADKTKNQIVMPATTEVFRYSGDELELTNCTIKGSVNHTITSHSNILIKDSNLDKYSLDTNKCEISNSTIHSLLAQGTTFISGSTVNYITVQDNLTTNSFNGTRHTKIKSLYANKNIVISLSDTDFNGENFSLNDYRSGKAISFICPSAFTTTGALYINNCTFSNYEISDLENKYSVLYIETDILNIEGSTIENCKSEKESSNTGILYTTSKSVNIINSNFFNNVSRPLTVEYSPTSNGFLTITGSTFSNNTATKYSGGAISCSCCTEVIIERSEFSNNTAEAWYGGAVYISAKTVEINDCTFTGNKNLETIKQQAGGGAIAISCNQNEVDATIRNCTFISNNSNFNGHDVFMNAAWGNNTSYSGCKLNIEGLCTTDKTSDSLYKNNIDVSGSITIR